MRKPSSPNCLWFNIYIYRNLELLVFDLLCIFPDNLSVFSKNCYKNDVSTSNVKYRHSAQLMAVACRDLSSPHFRDLEVILFLHCQVESGLWDIEHLWQDLSPSPEPTLCRISPLLVKNSINNWMHKCSILAGNPLNPWKGSERRSSVDISKQLIFF